MKTNFSFYKQPDVKDYGSACIRITAKYYGKLINPDEEEDFIRYWVFKVVRELI